MTEIDYAERVARGAALLDKEWPEWRDVVDLGRLDIAEPFHCMTAQFAQNITGSPMADYGTGKMRLNLDAFEYEAHGFNAHAADPIDDYNAGIAKLNELWRDLIVQHRYAPEPRPDSL